MVIALFSLALFAAALLAVMAVMITTLLPALPRIVALLADQGALRATTADGIAMPRSRNQLTVARTVTASARYLRQPLRVAA